MGTTGPDPPTGTEALRPDGAGKTPNLGGKPAPGSLPHSTYKTNSIQREFELLEKYTGASGHRETGRFLNKNQSTNADEETVGLSVRAPVTKSHLREGRRVATAPTLGTGQIPGGTHHSSEKVRPQAEREVGQDSQEAHRGSHLPTGDSRARTQPRTLPNGQPEKQCGNTSVEKMVLPCSQTPFHPLPFWPSLARARVQDGPHSPPPAAAAPGGRGQVLGMPTPGT